MRRILNVLGITEKTSKTTYNDASQAQQQPSDADSQQQQQQPNSPTAQQPTQPEPNKQLSSLVDDCLHEYYQMWKRAKEGFIARPNEDVGRLVSLVIRCYDVDRMEAIPFVKSRRSNTIQETDDTFKITRKGASETQVVTAVVTADDLKSLISTIETYRQNSVIACENTLEQKKSELKAAEAGLNKATQEGYPNNGVLYSVTRVEYAKQALNSAEDSLNGARSKITEFSSLKTSVEEKFPSLSQKPKVGYQR